MGTRDITGRLKFLKGLFVRGAGFALAVTMICGALAIGSALRHPSRGLPQSVAPTVEQESKDQTRVAAGERAADRHAVAAASVSIWHPGKMENAPPGESAEAAPPTASDGRPSEEWRQQDFASVSILDGRTFSSGGVTVRLAGLDLPPPDQVCRTLDNRLEQCATRAATQLELLTRARALACRYRMITSSEAVGSCRIGPHDLAERMLRTNYVRAADAGRTAMATMKASDAPSR
jgi:endonuclease YncB( thermonuclease family)